MRISDWSSDVCSSDLTIEYFGRFTVVARPGFNFYPAFFYRVGRKVNVMEQVLDIPGQEIITKDNAMISTDGVVFFNVLAAAKAAYEVDRKSVVEGKSVSVRVDLGGCRIIKKKKKKNI